MVGPLLTLMQKQQDALVDYYLEVRDHCDWALKVCWIDIIIDMQD